jgi:hypothetical protein
MGENEKPWIIAGHGGSVSGRLIHAQTLMVTAAMATVMMMLILFMEDGCPSAGHPTSRARVDTASLQARRAIVQG